MYLELFKNVKHLHGLHGMSKDYMALANAEVSQDHCKEAKYHVCLLASTSVHFFIELGDPKLLCDTLLQSKLGVVFRK